jgi:hypothetical protein
LRRKKDKERRTLRKEEPRQCKSQKRSRVSRFLLVRWNLRSSVDGRGGTSAHLPWPVPAPVRTLSTVRRIPIHRYNTRRYDTTTPSRRCRPFRIQRPAGVVLHSCIMQPGGCCPCIAILLILRPPSINPSLARPTSQARMPATAVEKWLQSEQADGSPHRCRKIIREWAAGDGAFITCCADDGTQQTHRLATMSSLSRRACYKCGNVGHYAEVCSSAERLCYNCKFMPTQSTPITSS